MSNSNNNKPQIDNDKEINSLDDIEGMTEEKKELYTNVFGYGTILINILVYGGLIALAIWFFNR